MNTKPIELIMKQMMNITLAGKHFENNGMMMDPMK